MKGLAILLTALLWPASTGIAKGADLAAEAKRTLEKATTYFRSISVNGGYAGIHSMDLRKRYGEALYEPAKPTEIWVQPPGTPSVGEAFLRAWRITGDPRYLDAARDAARALAWGQRKEGGWDHRVDVALLTPLSKKPERKSGHSTFDDDISQGALSFLMSLDQELDEDWLTDAVELGLSFMTESQFENGAWPQWYPLQGGYHDLYTFNDNAINDCIRIMLKAHRLYGREEFLKSAEVGGGFIIASQLAPPQAGWAQQYSLDMKPAWARKFEPPGVCSAATAGNIRTLVDLYVHTKDEKYLSPIPAAIEWLRKSKIGGILWSRFYELGTNKPIFGDHDGKVHYTYEEISEERKKGYAWLKEFGVESAIRYYKEVKERGSSTRRSDVPSAIRVMKVIADLDDRGRWIKERMIRSDVFVQNVNVLCAFLETTGEEKSLSPKKYSPYLAAALDAASWLRSAALDKEEGKTWPEDPDKPESLSTNLYSGSSGVVLFFLELYRVTRDPVYLEEAKAGARYLMAALPDSLESLDAGSLYTGLAGVGFALEEAHKASGDPAFREGALRCVRMLHAWKRDGFTEITDIIRGGAGIGLFLLYAHKEMDHGASRDLAAHIGRELLERGIPAEGGLKWRMDEEYPRLMPNFSHGTAGVAYFLATLYNATGEKEYLDGALAGARYLLAITTKDGLIFHHEPEGEDLFYLGWCHGPPGTCRLYYRLWKISGDEKWLEALHAGAKGVTGSGIPEKRTPGFWNNAGQCCGSAGVAEFFLALHRVTGRSDYLAFARRAANDVLGRAARCETGLKWIQAEHRVRPDWLIAQTGYMQGAAGVGMCLLHMYALDGDGEITFPDSPF